MLSILVSLLPMMSSPMMALEANLRWENMQFADCKLLTSLRCSLSVIRLVMGGCWLYRERCQHQADFFRLRLHSSRIIYVLGSAFDVSLFLWCKSLHYKKDISQYFICALLLPFRLYALLRNANSRRRRLTGHTAHFPHCSSLSNVTEIQKQKYKNTELLNAEYNVFLFS